MVSATAVLLVALAVIASAGGRAEAASRSVTGQRQYVCQIAESDKPSKNPIMTSSMQLSMQLNVPTTVAPGQSVALRGTLSLQFPEELAKYAKTLVDTANGYSDTISVAVTMNGRTVVARADRWQTPNVTVSNPLVVRAPITFPSFTVPNGSQGKISVAMPRDGVVKNPYFASPGRVAFTASAQASGAILNANFYLACAGASSTPTFATIPIGGAATSSTPASGGGSAGGPGATGPDDPDPSDDPFADSSLQATGSSDVGSADGTTVTGSSVGSDDLRDTSAGIFVPTGVLVGLETLICLAALAFAAWTGYRLHVLRSMLDD